MKKHKTAKLIFEKGIELIAHQGYKGTTIRQLTAEVGIREGSFYYHFPNKEALFLDILEYFRYELLSNEISDDAIDIMVMQFEPYDYFVTALDLFLERMTDPIIRDIWKILVAEQFLDSRAGKLLHEEIANKQTGDTIRVLKRMKHHGRIGDIDIESIATIFMSSLKGIFFSYLYDQGTSKQEIKKRMIKLISFFTECISDDVYDPASSYGHIAKTHI